MEPTVGRIVHYVSYGTPGGEYASQCRAAIVTEVVDNPDPETGEPIVLSLAVLNPTGVFFNTRIVEDAREDPSGGSWHWPERVEEDH